MPKIYPGAPWQGQQYVEELSPEVPDAAATGQYAALASAEPRAPGIPGWGEQATYTDIFTEQLGLRPGYTLPAATDATVVGGWLGTLGD